MTRSAPLRIGIVGQVNAGKTSVHESLLRYRDPDAVSAVPGWTRDVRSMTLSIERNGRAEIAAELLDFPGLQRAEALLAEMRSMTDESTESLLARLRGAGEFRHEELVIEHARRCDVLLLVVDSREAPGPAFDAELEVLRRLSGVEPILLLNFTFDPATRLAVWLEAAERAGCRDRLSFDAWHLAWAHEERLWALVAARLAGEAKSAAEAIGVDRRRRREDAVSAVLVELSDLLVDLAAARRPVRDRSEKRELEDAGRELMERARSRESRCAEAIVARLGFRRGDAVLAALGTGEEAVLRDPWTADELARRVPTLAKGLTAGAVVGGTVGAAAGFVLDLATAFTTVGAGTVFGAKLGAATGAMAGGAFSIRDVLVELPRFGRPEARLSRGAITLLALRQIELARSLLGRGHAAPSSAPSRGAAGGALSVGVRSEVERTVSELARANPSPRWSTLNGPVELDRPGRVEATRIVRHRLVAALETPDSEPDRPSLSSGPDSSRTPLDA